MKKAQSISINTIVIALIALLVLIVVIAVLSGNIKIFTGGTNSCASRGGTCGAPFDAKCQLPHYAQIIGTECEERTKVIDPGGNEVEQVCCVQIQAPVEEPVTP